ncbi:uncharacterized protein [Typha angustifolia]|uniref:uncharacterized protein n=1 Tax=Typha angustifolia TaxID=59011 RepID=UPI003C2B98A7
MNFTRYKSTAPPLLLSATNFFASKFQIRSWRGDPMTATATRPRRPRFRAAPPTPIRTAKGSRSAAANDLVLAEYLENSLKIPDLTLPSSHFPTRSPLPPPPAIADEIDLEAILSGDAAAVHRLLAAATESGAFSIRGGDDVAIGDVGSAIEVGSEVFRVSDEWRRREMGRWFRRRDAVGEEFYWYHPVTAEADRVLEEVLPDSYRILRDKMENIAAKLGMVAESVTAILSENAKNQKHSMMIGKVGSILCLTQYNSNQLRSNGSEFGSASSPHSYALSLHLSGCDQEFCLRSEEGSTFFRMPAGSILVTIGKQFQDWSCGEFKSAVGEILFELSDDANPFFSLEFFYSPKELHHVFDHKMTVSILDQLLITVVALALFYCIWIWIPSKLTSA